MDIQEIIQLLERIAEFLYQETEGNCPYCGAKDYPVCKNKKGYDEVKPEDAEEWRIDHSETCIVVSIDQVLTLLKQQPKATSIGNKIREIASKDILGQTKLVRDKDILNQAADRLDAWWKYINELKEEVDLLKQQPTAGEWTKVIRAYCKKASPEPWYWKSNRDVGKGTFDLLSEKQPELSFGILGDADFEGSRFGGIISPQTIANQEFIVNARIDLPEACDRLDRAEAINKDLLDACKELNSCFDKAFFMSGVVDLPKINKAIKKAEAAIAKAVIMKGK